MINQRGPTPNNKTMKTTQDKIYEAVAIALVIIGFVIYAIYNHEHTKNNYVTIPNTPANEQSVDQGTNCADHPFSADC